MVSREGSEEGQTGEEQMPKSPLSIEDEVIQRQRLSRTYALGMTVLDRPESRPEIPNLNLAWEKINTKLCTRTVE